jgi:hypothetical protein
VNSLDYRIFFDLSVFRYSKEHNVRETGSVSVPRQGDERHILYGVHQKELIMQPQSIGAPIILGRCPSLSAHESESMLRTYLVFRAKQESERERERKANGTWE